MSHKSKSIVLRRIAFGEADLIVTFFSRDAGRMSGIAKFARQSQKRFGGALEPGTLVELSFAERRGSQLARIEEAFVCRPAFGALKTLERITSMTRAVELAISFLQEHQPAPDKFDLLDSWLESLCVGDPSARDAVTFELNWLTLCGFGPNLRTCAVCGVSAIKGGGWSFDFDHGGVVCASCGRRGGRRAALDRGALDGLASLDDGGDSADEAWPGVSSVVGGYIDHILGRPLKTRAIY